MYDQADLNRRAGELKQALLLALKHANAAALDGGHDGADLETLTRAREQVRHARDQLDSLIHRLQFHMELSRLTAGTVSDESSRGLITLVRLGVDGGYDVTEVRRMVDQALGRA